MFNVSRSMFNVRQMSAPLSRKNLPENPTPDDILNVFLEYLSSTNTEPYDHQEEAILELFAGNNVILNTPTGSGKSLVALALQFKSLCQGRRSYYTVPIKALANEKFLSLCHVLGPENVGMITGDATVNHDAPVICCTAEILANIALRDGASAPVDDVIMDEFHYYSDHSRGTAWQIPLLTLPRARFLLMSATLGDSSFFSKQLTSLTGAPTSLVQSDQRPVPLEFQYSTTQLQEKVAELNEQGRSPIYLVHFTQNACADTARDLLSTNFCTKEEKHAIARALDDADFRSPYGRELSKILRHGVGIHHAGLLPKYRLLVEKLTARGLLKVVCGTDTLGVGVNVPIRTVMLTSLCKYDGRGTKILAVRDFRQIVGRAGRRGFDTVGYVVAQAPEHIIENLRLAAKASANKKKSFEKRKPPEKGYVHWDDQTFAKLQTAPPEPLVSSFSVYHHTLLNVLSRTHEDGCAELKKIIDDSHEPPSKKNALKKHAFKLFRGLIGAKILHIIPPAKRTGPQKVVVDVSLPEDFSINHALSLYLLDAIPQLDIEAEDYALNVISLIESILENPDIVLRKQVDLLKSELMARLKDEGMEFDDRIALLEQVEHPKPGAEFIYTTYNEFKLHHPYLGDENVKPKTIAREMIENYQSFDDYVKTYKIERAEAVLLRHLSEVYKVLAQTVPDHAKTEHLHEAESFLELIVRHTDSSLLDEWQAMKNPEAPRPDKSSNQQSAIINLQSKIPYTKNKSAFTRHLRNHVLTLVTALSRYDTEATLSLIANEDSIGKPWSNERLLQQLNTYHAARHQIRLDPEARNARHTHISEDGLAIHQTLIDPDDLNDWAIHLTLDLKKSNEARTPVLHLESIAPI
jgi:superfamily II RNA helicase